MATSEIYETQFDEDVPTESTSSESCPECGGVVRTNTAETVCEDCGLVIEDQQIDHGPEWRGFDNEDRERTGAPLTERRHDRGLSTEIGRTHDGKGCTLSGKKRRQLSRLRREHTRATWRTTAERNLGHGLGEIRRMAGSLGVADSIVEQACALFRRAQDEGLLPGRSIEAMAGGCVYAICRCNGLPRTQRDISVVAQVDGERVTHAYNVLNRELSLPSVPVPPAAYVSQIASTVGLSEGTRRGGEYIAERAHKEGLSNGKHPVGVAAGALYLAAQERVEAITQQALAQAAGVSALTVRTRWEELEKIVEYDRT